MNRVHVAVAAIAVAFGYLLLSQPRPAASAEARLARHRNLGKAFYENPTTQNEALAEFRAALALAPNSLREQLNVALALLRAGKTAEGVSELEKVQKRDPSIPHTWFNLGVQYKKLGETEKAIAQFEQMIRLVRNEPISAYNLGALYRQAGRAAEAEKYLKQAAALDANLAAPHFQLFNLYRTTNRAEEAKRELAIFQQLKKQQEGAAIPEDVDWSAYAEIYDIASDAPPQQEIKLSFQSRPGKHVFQQVEQADFNNDGLIDTLTLTPAGGVLKRRTAAGLVDVPLPAPKQAYNTAVWIDYDHDYDLDLVLLGQSAVLLRNQGTAGFQDRSSDIPFAKGTATGAVVLRVLPDTKGFDLIVSYRDRDSVLYRDLLGGKFVSEPVALPRGAWRLTAFDHGNDSDFDVAFVEGDRVGLLLNKDGKFTASPFRAAAKAYAVADPDHGGVLNLITPGRVYTPDSTGFVARSNVTGVPAACDAMAAVDINADNLPDIACASGNSVSVAANTTHTPYKWLRVKLTGVRNPKLAPHAEVEVKAGPRYQKRLYSGEALTFGLGSEAVADTVRITWPNGLIQNETRQPAGKLLTYREAQRLSGSCPIIWTWNGKGFEYITDVLGVAPLGASSGDGSYFATDHDEYIQIPGESLVPKDGAYEVRITEELSEVAYLDLVRLIAVDHPADIEIYTNEKFQAPPFPEFRLFGVSRRIAPVRAVADESRDVLAQVRTKDRRYADGFARSMSGVAKPHTLTLDFGPDAARDGKAILVLNGWVDWADGSTFLGVSQERKGGMQPPSLQMKDGRGEWRTVIEDMGMPAGKPKSIVADLSGKWLSSSREVRIVTNLCVYWDEIFLSEQTAAPELRMTTVRPGMAALNFRGFSPSIIHPERRQPEAFTYEGAQPVSLWNPTPGLYTRYGDVLALTSAVDDRMIVMGSGDEVRLKFDAAAVPALPKGWRRDFLLLVDGWAKDRDANTAESQTTTPLPFHAMSRFPYPASEQYPQTPENLKYLREYNTRPALRLMRPLR